MIFTVAPARELYQQVHDARAGRRHHHGNAARRRHGAEFRACFSKPGDELRLTVSGLGEQRLKVVAEDLGLSGPEGVEVVHGAPALADVKLIGRGDRGADIGLGLGCGFAERSSLGKLGGDGR